MGFNSVFKGLIESTIKVHVLMNTKSATQNVRWQNTGGKKKRYDWELKISFSSL